PPSKNESGVAFTTPITAVPFARHAASRNALTLTLFDRVARGAPTGKVSDRWMISIGPGTGAGFRIGAASGGLPLPKGWGVLPSDAHAACFAPASVPAPSPG